MWMRVCMIAVVVGGLVTTGHRCITEPIPARSGKLIATDPGSRLSPVDRLVLKLILSDRTD